MTGLVQSLLPIDGVNHASALGEVECLNETPNNKKENTL